MRGPVRVFSMCLMTRPPTGIALCHMNALFGLPVNSLELMTRTLSDARLAGCWMMAI